MKCMLGENDRYEVIELQFIRNITVLNCCVSQKTVQWLPEGRGVKSSKG